MKKTIFVVLIFFTSVVSAQSVISGDTLIIRQTNITENPFRFGDNPLQYLLRQRKEKPGIVKKTAVENVHVENKMDTTFDIRFGEDRFTLYKWDDGNGLISAHLKSPRFTTKFGIRTGMTKAEVIRLLPSLNLTTIPRVLILEDLETSQRLTFQFKSNLVAGIEFSGYID